MEVVEVGQVALQIVLVAASSIATPSIWPATSSNCSGEAADTRLELREEA